MSELNPAAAPAPRRGPGCFTTLALTLLAVVIVGGVVAWKVVDAGFGMKWLAEHLQKRTITESFHENVRRIASTQGDVLELATLETEETVTKFDTKTLFNDAIYLGTSVAEIRAMVVYRYHLKLSGAWNIKVENGRCLVVAPSIRPSLPPAVRSETMEKKSESGWMRFNAAEIMAELEKGLTSILERRAVAPGKIQHVREASRLSVAKFVEHWVLKEPKEHEGGIHEIVVVFEDEADAANAAAAFKRPATLNLDVKAD